MTSTHGNKSPPVASIALSLVCLISGLPAYELHMNCGGESVQAPDGTVFVGDEDYSAGGAGFVGGSLEPYRWWPVGGTDNEEIYHSFRSEFAEFKADLPSDEYILTLHFCEMDFYGPGFRVLKVLAEGRVLIDSLDTFSLADHAYALPLRLPLLINDGQMNLFVISLAGGSFLSGIELVSHATDSTPPAVPSDFTARNGYSSALLRWSRSSEEDFAGVLVYRQIDGQESCITSTPVSLPYLIDRNLSAGDDAYYSLKSVDVFGNTSQATDWKQVVALSLAESPLPVYQLEVDPDSLSLLLGNVYSDHYVPADFRGEDTLYSPVALRLRGNVARMFTKKSYKIRLDEGDLFLGGDRLNINGDYADWSMLRSKLGFDLFQAAGVRPTYCHHVHLQLNNRFKGIYTHVEQVDVNFLERTGRDPGGSIYKCNGNLGLLGSEAEYVENYDKKTNDEMGYGDLIEFIEAINLTSQDIFPTTMLRRLDIASYLRFLAVIVATGNSDFTVRNYYLVHDLEKDAWEIIPWDLDLSFGLGFPFEFDTIHHPPINPDGIGGPNMLQQRILEVPAFRSFYCAELQELLGSSFAPSVMAETIDSLYALIAQDAWLDVLKLGRENNSMFDNAPGQLRDYVVDRNVILRDEIPQFAPTESVFVFANEIQSINDTTVADEYGENDPWVELYNMSPGARDMGGWRLGFGNATWSIPDTSIAAGGFLLIWLDGEPDQGPMHCGWVLPQQGGSVTLISPYDFIQDSVNSTDIGPDLSFGRQPDGSQRWVILSEPSPGVSNGSNGGSPPVISELSREPMWPEESDEVVVTARVDDDDGDLARVDLLVDFEAGFMPHEMSDDGSQGDGGTGDGVFGGTISPHPTGMMIRYLIRAEDEAGNCVVYPSGLFPPAYVVGWRAPSLVLNEFMARNDTTISDEFGEYEDWIELYNPGDEELQLAELFLTDDLSEPTKWHIPHVNLGAGQFLLIWADDDTEQGEFHASFKLSASGEELGLFAHVMNGSFPVDTLTFRAQEGDISMGRYPDGTGSWGAMGAPTPGSHNTNLGIGPGGTAQTLPHGLRVECVWPSPASGRFMIRLGLPVSQELEIMAYDLMGREVAMLCKGSPDAGWFTQTLTPSLPPGAYVLGIHGEETSLYKRIVVVR